MSKRTTNYTQEFRDEAVKLALQSPTISCVAKSLGIPEGTLHTWLHKAKTNGKLPVSISSTHKTSLNTEHLLEDNKALRKRVARLEQEKEILKKAATCVPQARTNLTRSLVGL